MPRSLAEIIAHIRMVIANPSVSTTLIQTEDLTLMCDEIERLRADLACADAVIDAGGEPSPQCSFSQYAEWSLAARKRHAERHGLAFPTLPK